MSPSDAAGVAVSQARVLKSVPRIRLLQLGYLEAAQHVKINYRPRLAFLLLRLQYLFHSTHDGGLDSI